MGLKQFMTPRQRVSIPQRAASPAFMPVVAVDPPQLQPRSGGSGHHYSGIPAEPAFPFQLRAATDPYHTLPWTYETWKTYRPPGNPVRTDLPGINEELADAKTARDAKKPKSIDLARAWVNKAFDDGLGGPGDVTDVYVAKDDKDAGGYSLSQKVAGMDLIVIHAHMEKNHLPARSTSAPTEENMGPVHWKWADQQLVSGAGGPFAPAQYPRLLNIPAARTKRSEQILAEHGTANTESKLAELVLKVMPSASVAGLVLSTLVSRYAAQAAPVEAYLKTLAETAVPNVKAALAMAGGESAKDVLIRAQLLTYLAGGQTLEATIIKRDQLAALEQTRVEEIRPVKPDTGTMELKPALGGIDVKAANVGLTQPKLLQIREVFDRIMRNVKYNSAAMPLEFIQDVRKARKTTPGATMESVLGGFERSGPDLITKYGAADCVGMAEQVRIELAKLGIHSDVIGANGGNYLNEIPDPLTVGRGRVSNEAARKYAVYSHASVVVPYIGVDGIPKAIHMEAGMGPEDKFFRQYESLFEAETELSKQKYQLDRAIADPKELQKMHVRCKWKMYLSDSVDQSRKVFIDLAEGSVFVSGWKDPAMVQAVAGTKINFQEILAEPAKEVTITLKAKREKIQNAHALVLFLDAVREDFGLDESFVTNMLYLTSHVREYSEQILLAPINAVRVSMDLKEKVIRTRAQAEELDKDHTFNDQLVAGNEVLKGIPELLQAGNATKVLEKYNAALVIFDKIVTDVHAVKSTDVTPLRAETIALRDELKDSDKVRAGGPKHDDFESAKALIAQGDEHNKNRYADKAKAAFKAAKQALTAIRAWTAPVAGPDDDVDYDSGSLFG